MRRATKRNKLSEDDVAGQSEQRNNQDDDIPNLVGDAAAKAMAALQAKLMAIQPHEGTEKNDDSKNKLDKAAHSDEEDDEDANEKAPKKSRRRKKDDDRKD